jgi:hypothetical protein
MWREILLKNLEILFILIMFCIWVLIYYKTYIIGGLILQVISFYVFHYLFHYFILFLFKLRNRKRINKIKSEISWVIKNIDLIKIYSFRKFYSSPMYEYYCEVCLLSFMTIIPFCIVFFIKVFFFLIVLFCCFHLYNIKHFPYIQDIYIIKNLRSLQYKKEINIYKVLKYYLIQFEKRIKERRYEIMVLSYFLKNNKKKIKPISKFSNHILYDQRLSNQIFEYL